MKRIKIFEYKTCTHYVTDDHVSDISTYYITAILLTSVVRECQNEQLYFNSVWSKKIFFLLLLVPYLRDWSLKVDTVVWFSLLSTSFVLTRLTKSFFFCFEIMWMYSFRGRMGRFRGQPRDSFKGSQENFED